MQTSFTPNERLSAMLAGTLAPNPILSYSYRISTGEVITEEVPEFMQQPFMTAWINTMLAEVVKREAELDKLQGSCKS